MENTIKKLILMKGIPGSGKSTKAKTLAPKSNIFSTDDYWMKNGKYVFNGARLGAAHEWNQERVDRAMMNEVNPILVDNTNIKKSDYKKYVQYAKCHGYEVEFAMPDSPWWQDMYPRIKSRTFTDEDINLLVDKNTHGVPFDAIKKMMNNWEEE